MTQPLWAHVAATHIEGLQRINHKSDELNHHRHVSFKWPDGRKKVDMTSMMVREWTFASNSRCETTAKECYEWLQTIEELGIGQDGWLNPILQWIPIYPNLRTLSMTISCTWLTCLLDRMPNLHHLVGDLFYGKILGLHIPALCELMKGYQTLTVMLGGKKASTSINDTALVQVLEKITVPELTLLFYRSRFGETPLHTALAPIVQNTNLQHMHLQLGLDKKVSPSAKDSAWFIQGVTTLCKRWPTLRHLSLTLNYESARRIAKKDAEALFDVIKAMPDILTFRMHMEAEPPEGQNCCPYLESPICLSFCYQHVCSSKYDRLEVLIDKHRCYLYSWQRVCILFACLRAQSRSAIKFSILPLLDNFLQLSAPVVPDKDRFRLPYYADDMDGDDHKYPPVPAMQTSVDKLIDTRYGKSCLRTLDTTTLLRKRHWLSYTLFSRTKIGMYTFAHSNTEQHDNDNHHKVENNVDQRRFHGNADLNFVSVHMNTDDVKHTSISIIESTKHLCVYVSNKQYVRQNGMIADPIKWFPNCGSITDDGCDRNNNGRRRVGQ